MSNFAQIKGRLFNQPLLLEPTYAQVLIGALTDKLNIESLDLGDEIVNAEQLKEGAFSFSNDRSEAKPYRVIGSAAYIPISGSLVAKSGYLRPTSGMTGYDGIKVNLDMALGDDQVNEIIFEMDSSGGEVKGCFELADYIYENRGSKTMTALVTGLACSACYALASACDKIVIAETATVGSVGVITAHTSVEKAMSEKGVKVTLIYAGNHKADGNPYKDLPEDVKERFQSRIDSIYSMFTTRVAKYRGISVDAVVKTQALTYMGDSAIAIGFADEVVSTLEFMSQTSGNNIKLEQTMPKETEAKTTDNVDLDAKVAEAKAAGVKAGGAEMQQRIKAILTCDEADGRGDLANHLAFNTTMSAEDASGMLAVAAKEVTEPVTSDDKADTDDNTGFQEAMSQSSAEDVGADDTETTVTAESDPVKFAIQAHSQING